MYLGEERVQIIAATARACRLNWKYFQVKRSDMWIYCTPGRKTQQHLVGRCVFAAAGCSSVALKRAAPVVLCRLCADVLVWSNLTCCQLKEEGGVGGFCEVELTQPLFPPRLAV